MQLIKVNRIKSYDKKLFPMKILVLELLVIAGVTFVLAGNYELIYTFFWISILSYMTAEGLPEIFRATGF